MLIYLLFGILAGVLGGMGMGGGTVLIPLLTFFIGTSQNLAQGLNLLAFLPMSIIAILIHSENNLVKFSYGIITILAGVLSAFLGGLIANYLDQNLLRISFGVFLILLSIFELIKIFKK